MEVIEEIGKVLVNSKLGEETKKYFEELSNFVDWFAPNEKMNEYFQTVILLLLEERIEEMEI